MLKKIITFFIDRPLIGYFTYGTVFLVFLIILPQMYRDFYPFMNTPYMYVRTYYPGASAQEIETKITNKLEKKLAAVPNIENSISYSQQHVSIIIIKANGHLNSQGIERVQKQIRDEIQNIKDLPYGSLPPVLEILDTTLPVTRLALVQKNNDEVLLNKTYQDFENKLRTLKNIGKITKFGVPQKQILIELDPYKLKQFGISGYDVIESLSLNLQNFPSGTYYQNLTNYNVIGFGEITDLKQLRNHTLVANDNGGKTTLNQLGEIRFNLQPEDHFFKINGRPSIIFEIKHTPSTDYINIAKDIIKASKDYHQNDCEVIVYENNSRYLNNRISALSSNLITGLILVFITLYIFLGRKVSIFVSLGIPFSFAGTFIFMYFTHISINAISLAGLIIILGMIVDDTVTIADNVYRHHENGKPLREACIDATNEIFGGVFMSYLTTMVSFLPLAIIPGLMGTLFRDLPIVVMVCMTISILEGILIFPGHLIHFEEAKNPLIEKSKKFNQRLNDLLQTAIDKVLENNKLFIFGVLVLTTLSILYLKTSTYVFFPEEAVETFYVLTESKNDITLAENVKLISEVEKIIQALPQGTVKNYVTSHGINGLFNKHFRNTKFGKRYSQVCVYLSPRNQRKLRISEIMSIIEEKIKQKDLFSDIQLIQENVGPPTDKPFSIDLMGNNLAVTNIWANKIYNQLKSEKGVFDLTYNANDFGQETRLTLNQNRISQYGLSGVQVLAELRTGLDGFPLNGVNMTVDQEQIPVVIRTKKIEGDLNRYLSILSMNNHKGGMIPLSKLTYTEIVNSPMIIFHRDGQRAVRIEANINPKITSGLKLREKYIKKYEKLLPEKVKFNKNRIIFDEEESIQQMSRALAVSFLLNFLCLMLYYNSITKPLLVLASVPGAAIGVAFILFIQNVPFSTAVHMALVGLIGAVVNNAIILVDHIDLLLKEGLEAHLAVKRAVKEKFRAIVLTAGATVLGLITTAYGVGGYEPFIAPLMLATNWGLISSTILILFLIPCFYIQKTIKKIR